MNMSKKEGESRKLLIVLGESGTGKSTLVAAVCKNFPHLKEILSTLTRPIRDGERDGIDAIFLSKERYEQMLDEGLFLTDVCHFGNHYGYQKALVEEGNVLHCIPSTMLELKEKLPDRTIITVQLVFSEDPEEAQKIRLYRLSGDESRLSRVEKEASLYSNLEVDYTLVNKEIPDFLENALFLAKLMQE